MTHKGKNVDQAMAEAWAYLSADPVRLKNSDPSDVKKLVNTWLAKSGNGQVRKPVKNWKL